MIKFYSNAYAKRRGKQTRLPELPKEVSEEVWVEVPAKAEEADKAEAVAKVVADKVARGHPPSAYRKNKSDNLQ